MHVFGLDINQHNQEKHTNANKDLT